MNISSKLDAMNKMELFQLIDWSNNPFTYV